MKLWWIGLLLLGALPGLRAEVLLDRPMNSDADFKNSYGRVEALSKIVDLPEGGKAVEFTVPDDSNVKPESKLSFQLDGAKIAGRRVHFTGEVKVVTAAETSKWGGGEFSMWFPYQKGYQGFGYDHVHIGTKAQDWRKLDKVVDVPSYATHMLFNIGISNARGTVLFRNIKAETVSDDILISFPLAANRAFKDEVAGDQKGGWHDGGSAYDARNFNWRQQVYGGVPFAIIDPAKNKDNTVVVFASPRFPDGAKEVSAKFDAKAKFVYLLHAAAWAKSGETAGVLELTSQDGQVAKFDVVVDRDIADWFPLKPLANAVVGSQFAAGGGIGGVYVSCFALPENFGTVKELKLSSPAGVQTTWMVLAATLSPQRYEVEKPQELVIRENDVWKALPQDIIAAPKAGTALDFDLLFQNQPCGVNGRVTVKDGHFVFAKDPGKPLRFMAIGSGRDFGSYFGVPAECDTKERISAYAEQMRRNGYNMIRWWPQARTSKEKAFENDPVKQDLQDWFYYELKRNGIYVILSVDDWTAGYDYCNVWTDPRKKEYSIFLDPKHRENWLKWVTINLTRQNPYTKTALLDDPMLVGIDCNNELEFYFYRADNRYAPLWRSFLEAKYQTFDNLQKAWGDEIGDLKSFADIVTFVPVGGDKKGAVQRDRSEFVTKEEAGLLQWQVAELRKLGFQGVVTNYCMGRSMRHVGLRDNADFVMQNGYHAHPIGGSVGSGGRTPQDSAIASEANSIRTFLSSRMYGKPYVVSEHGHVFWNQYRYEQGLMTGAYAALNDFDALTAFFMQVTTLPNQRITAFEIRHDPVARAAELITALLYRREDVKSSKVEFRIRLDVADAVKNATDTDSVSATQLKLGLLGQTYVDTTSLPVLKDQILLERLGSSKTAVRQADTNIIDMPSQGFRFDQLVNQLKERGMVPKNNRTNEEKGIYESVTGEIVLNAPGKTFEVNTPRLQGICAEAKSTMTLPALDILSMDRKASIALAAIDGDKPLQQADRLLLFVVTNALNSNMKFAAPDMLERLDAGTTPTLIETGTFRLAVKTANIGGMKLYPLRLDGTRMDPLPVKMTADGRGEFVLETAKYPTFYFELSK